MRFYVSLKSTEATLSSGAPLVRGSEVDLTPSEYEDPHNARLIAEGTLIGVANPDKSQTQAVRTVESKTGVRPDTQEGGAAQ
jgi:hypothetical protein